MSNGETNNRKRVEIVVTNLSGQHNSVEKSFVLPGSIHVTQGEMVEFTAIETHVKLLFPNHNLLHPKYREKLSEEGFLVIEEGETDFIKINTQIDSGVYSYAVVTTANHDLASGGSFPKFIVE
ncbi:MAG: hypothetical protein R3220_04020 [Balneolaceae bacterium]|nr:hypothetical protein [Balneolaceae bacterium]